MFNFHKPRTYRSTEGCCICKAKSSSSRFTDSRKYEKDMMQCFDLKYPRQGEICNACVLLVKRFKRLPVGTKRNWSHIVDAKAGIGPGCSKIQTKYKSERINSKTAAQQKQGHVPVSSSENNAENSTGSSTGLSALHGMCFIPEKFSKIFKKSKKLKHTFSCNSKRKSVNNGWSQNSGYSLPTTPDSLDSDYEDTRLHASLSGSVVVQFQTQTRASAYKAQIAAEAKKKIIKLGTRRRKCLPPRKYCRSLSYDESLKFFDEDEWHERKSCCGMLYECVSLGGALLIDIDNYKPCEKHRQLILNYPEETKLENVASMNIKNEYKNMSKLYLPKLTQGTPAMLQLQPYQRPTNSPSSSSSTDLISTNSTNNSFITTTTTMPVLKKHHLFFKRQSELFPQGDVAAMKHNTKNEITCNTENATDIKTENEKHQHQQLLNNQQYEKHIIGSTSQRPIENAIVSNSALNHSSAMLTNSLTSLTLGVLVTSSSVATTSPSTTTMPQMPKHSLAKVATISPPLTRSIHHNLHHHNANSNNTLPLVKPNTFPHKIKAEPGKIVKHSLEKFNTAIKLKTSDINELKHVVRTVDKPHILAKPQTSNTGSVYSATTATVTYQSLTSYNTSSPALLTTTSLSAASPASSTSSTSSTKFSDNSSDSGFDENVLDRKSASPLQEDCEKKILTRPAVQTMFLASGGPTRGQPQNLILTGNDAAAKILQNRKYNSITTPTTNVRTLNANHHPTTTAVKIAQISTAPLSSSPSIVSSISAPTSMSSAAQAKMRAIYNNNNTIQHENGITTIVPASSLAASTQTAAMQNIAPSTVTITPAPPMGTQFNPHNVISRKLTTTNMINLQSNTKPLSNFHNNSYSSHHLRSCSSSSSSSGSSHNHNTSNQKIILLKTPTALTGAGKQPGSSGSGR